MLKINVKLAIRNLRRKKLYTFINFTGLSVASAFAILIFLFIKQENNYDQFHERGKNLYRLEVTNLFNFGNTEPGKSFFSFLYKEDQKRNQLRMPVMLPEELKQSFPEVKNFVRLTGFRKSVIRLNNQGFQLDENEAAIVEKNFFSVFSFPLLKGNAHTVLTLPNQLVISERAAKKYFGDDDPIGKTIEFESVKNKLFSVSGVMKDFPASSSMQFDLVMPVESEPSFEKYRQMGGATNSRHLVILELNDNVNLPAFEKKLDAFCKNFYAASFDHVRPGSGELQLKDFHAILRPFAAGHFNASDAWFHYTDVQKIYQLISLTLLVLLIVCINYVLLTLTSTAARSQEVGIRKTIGAERKQIIVQFWMETQLLVFASVVAGFLIAVNVLPLFNQLIGANLLLRNISVVAVVGMLLALSVVLGLLAGVYPALAMSGLQPLKMLRGHATYKINPQLSKVFVVLQYTTCIVLIISSMVIAKQMKFMLNKDLGFDKEQVVLIETPHGFISNNFVSVRQRLYQYAAADPGIAKATFTAFRFADGFNLNSHNIDGKTQYTSEMNVDYNYFDFNNIPIIKGRPFLEVMPTDTIDFDIPIALKDSLSSSTNRAIVVNETLYDLLGKPPMDAINKPMGSRIIGVCKDYHYWGLTSKIEPAYHLCNPTMSAFFWVKIKPGQDMPVTLERIHSNWNKITGNSPFSYAFMDETVQRFYEPHQRWMKTVTLFSWLAVFLSCLGLFGLSGLNALNRTKEIGIRKVLGASVQGIFLLLNKDFIRLAAIALIIAVPLAAYFVYQWLQNFAYRTPVDWTIYALAAVIGLLSAAVAVSYHTIKAAVANPVKSLKTE